MSAYHQMGYDSWNLVGEEALARFRGMILSPVNDSPTEMAEKLKTLRKRRTDSDLDIVLDPQFYKPKSDRGALTSWAHFANEYETTNLDDWAWWGQCCDRLTNEALAVSATSVCSPALLPRTFDADYYNWTVTCADVLQDIARQRSLSTLMTAVVRVPELAHPGAPERIASILTKSSCSRVYLVLSDDLSPREQRTDAEGIAGAMLLVQLLQENGSRVLVAFSGLDMLLWKNSGASDVATGKFFNLRRFVPGRWDDPKEGGRVLPYWTDGGLITWLREDDLRLLLRLGLIDPQQASSNPYSRDILAILEQRSGQPWVGLGWRQYMYWFAQTEAEIGAGQITARDMLVSADAKWAAVEKSKAVLFERTNSGEWIRAWLNALILH